MQSPTYTIAEIGQILNADAKFINKDAIITYLIIDSRSVLVPENSLFFALMSLSLIHI